MVVVICHWIVLEMWGVCDLLSIVLVSVAEGQRCVVTIIVME